MPEMPLADESRNTDQLPEIVRRVRDRFTHVNEIESIQRDNEHSDMFFAEIDQWDSSVRDNREGKQTYSKAVLSANALNPALEVYEHEYQAASLGVSVASTGVEASMTTRYLQSLMDDISGSKTALQARKSAYRRALRCGRGFYMIQQRFEKEAPDLDNSALDQIVEIVPIKDQSSVYFPMCDEPDLSDAEWCILSHKMSLTERNERWPDKPVEDEGQFFSPQFQNTDWYSVTDTKLKEVRVAFYWERVVPKGGRKTILISREHGAFFEDDAPDELKELWKKGDPTVRSRVYQRKVMKRYVVDGTQILEESTHPDYKRFPLIPVIGKHAYADSRDVWKGEVRDSRDLVESLNYVLSESIRAIAQPLTIILYQDELPNGIDDLMDIWRDPKPVLALQRQPGTTGPPAIQTTNFVADLAHLVTMMQHIRDMLMHAFGMPEYTTRANALRERSGESQAVQADLGGRSYDIYMTNLENVTLPAEAEALIERIRDVYDRPGRQVDLSASPSGKEAPFLIRRPFTREPKTKRPIPLPHPRCRGTGWLTTPEGVPTVIDETCAGTGFMPREEMPDEHEGQQVEYVDFSEGEWQGQVDVKRQEENERKNRVASMASIAAASPDMMVYFMDHFFRELGLPEVADRMQAQIPQMVDPDGSMSPSALNMLRQKDATIQEMQQALQQANDLIRSDVAKVQAQTEGKIAEVRAKSEAEMRREAFSKRVEALAEQDKREGEVTMASLLHEFNRGIELIRGDVQTKLTRLKTESAERIAGEKARDDRRATAIEAETKREQQDSDEEIERLKIEAAKAAAEAAPDKPAGGSA